MNDTIILFPSPYHILTYFDLSSPVPFMPGAFVACLFCFCCMFVAFVLLVLCLLVSFVGCLVCFVYIFWWYGIDGGQRRALYGHFVVCFFRLFATLPVFFFFFFDLQFSSTFFEPSFSNKHTHTLQNFSKMVSFIPHYFQKKKNYDKPSSGAKLWAHFFGFSRVSQTKIWIFVKGTNTRAAKERKGKREGEKKRPSLFIQGHQQKRQPKPVCAHKKKKRKKEKWPLFSFTLHSPRPRHCLRHLHRHHLHRPRR